MSRRDAVLLMAYGGPESLDELEPYLLDVRAGRPLSPEFLADIRSRYVLIGGKSPLRERTFEQAKALESELGVKTYVGMRHWKPFIGQTFEQIAADGVTDVVAIAMAPHYSRMSVGAYRRNVEDARARVHGGINVRYVASWHDHPLFLDAVAEQARRAGIEGRFVIFTAHSLPERILSDGDPYHDEFVSSANAVADRLGLKEWRWAYQSAGATDDKWLGPDVINILDTLSVKRIRDILIVPIGFVCDHVEVLYDVDILYRDYAASKGMSLTRSPSLNATPSFIRALAAIAREGFAP